MDEDVRHSTIADELLRGNTVMYFTIGVSMRPLLFERKTHVMIKPLENAKNGDIVLYIRQNGAYVLHRLMKQDDAFYYMRGDNTYGLEPIKKEQAIGVVTQVYRKGKMIDVQTSKGYQAYVVFWNGIYPFRWGLWKMKALARRILK